jgi:hypothetical protein
MSAPAVVITAPLGRSAIFRRGTAYGRGRQGPSRHDDRHSRKDYRDTNADGEGHSVLVVAASGRPACSSRKTKGPERATPPFPHPKRSRSPSRSTPSTNHPARSTPHHRRGLDGPAPARLLVLPPRPSAGSFGGGLTVTRCLGHSDPSSPSASSTRGATTPFQDSPPSSQPGLAFARACDRDGLCLALFGCSRGGARFLLASRLVEPGFERAVEAQDREPALAGDGAQPVDVGSRFVRAEADDRLPVTCGLDVGEAVVDARVGVVGWRSDRVWVS